MNFALISFVCESDALETFCFSPVRLHEEEITNLFDIIKTFERICEPIKENGALQGIKPKPDINYVIWRFIESSLERFLSMVYCRLKGIRLIVDESEKAAMFIDESRLVRSVKEYLSENISERLSIETVCSHFEIGKTSLMKKFKDEIGVGVMEYFVSLKTDRAKEMIAITSMDVYEIADALGFSSANCFSRVFKYKVGVTPIEYNKHVSKRRTLKK